MKNLAALLIVIFGITTTVKATTYTLSGDWVTGTWSPSYPGTTIASGDEVIATACFIGSSGGITVTFEPGSSLTTNSLCFIYPNSVLNLHGTTVINNMFRMLGSGNAVHNYGSFTPAATNGFLLTSFGEFVNEVGGTFNNNGTTWQASSASTFTNKGHFINPVGVTLDLSTAGFTFNNMADGTLENNGTLNVSSGVVFTMDGIYSGNGSITIPTFTTGTTGTIAPTPGASSLHFSGILMHQATLDVEIGGPNSNQYSRVFRTSGFGSVIGGTLNVSLTNGYTPTTQTDFQIIYSNNSGPVLFSSVNFPNDGNTWEVLTHYPCIECTSVRVTPPSGSTWTGSNSTAWNDAGNWSAGSVPGASDNVIIPNVTNDPIITGDRSAADITVQSGALLRVAGGGSLTLEGALDNSGTVTIQSGGSFLQGAGSSITSIGTFNVQRQGDGGSSYNYWSSPMQSWSGIPGNGTYLFNPNTSTESYADDQDPDPGWTQYDGAMTPGRGYAGSGGGLATFTGTPSNGSVAYPLTYYPASPGNTAPGTPSNLCGNPYPSAISCLDLITTNTDIDGAIYFWDDDQSGGTDYTNTDYGVWNGTGSLGTGGSVAPPNGFIGSCQGFMVRAASPGAVLNFDNGMRATTNSQFFRMASSEDARAWISLSNDQVYNQMLIGVLQDATDARDRIYDAEKIRGSNDIALASIIGTDEFCIQALGQSDQDRTVPLVSKVAQMGIYTFKVDSVEGFSNGQLMLRDNQDGESYPLIQGAEYTFFITPADEYGRFQLGVSATATSMEDENEEAVEMWVADKSLIIEGTENGRSLVEVFDMSGKRIWADQVNLITGTTRVELPALSVGQYIVRMQNDALERSIKTILN